MHKLKKYFDVQKCIINWFEMPFSTSTAHNRIIVCQSNGYHYLKTGQVQDSQLSGFQADGRWLFTGPGMEQNKVIFLHMCVS